MDADNCEDVAFDVHYKRGLALGLARPDRIDKLIAVTEAYDGPAHLGPNQLARGFVAGLEEAKRRTG